MERKPDWLPGFPVQIYCNRETGPEPAKGREQTDTRDLDLLYHKIDYVNSNDTNSNDIDSNDIYGYVRRRGILVV